MRFLVLSVRVPKDSELGPIAAEQIITTFHGIYSSIGFWDRIFGISPDQISLEIANVNNSITFYVTCPKKLRTLVEGQVYAQYPDVEIELVQDYADERLARSSRGGMDAELFKNAVGVELQLTGPDFDPIKRYPQFEDRVNKVYIDPMAGITSSLAKLNDPSEQVWLQIVLKPLQDSWRLWYTRTAWMMNQGVFANIEKIQDIYADIICTRKLYLRVIFFPYYIYLYLRILFTGVGKNIFELDGAEGEVLDEAISKMHEKETAESGRMDKIAKLLYEVNVRIVYLPKNKKDDATMSKLKEIVGSFKQFNLPFLNGFEDREYIMDRSIVERYRMRWMEDPVMMNCE